MRASGICPNRDIVGMRTPGAPSRRPYSPSYWGNEREDRYLRTRMVRSAARRCMLSMPSRCSLNPCREACLFHRLAMLTDVDYWIACGGYDPSALGSMIPRASHGRCSASAKLQ